MARYTGPVCRLCRREGKKLFLKGDKCYSDKCAITQRSYGPGQHGQSRKKLSEYGLQLRAKQATRFYYGILENQFSKYFDMAERKSGMTGENLLQILESRLDNFVYRSGMASSRKEARQLVLHRHFLVNGKTVNIPSYLLKENDVVQLSDKSKSSEKIKSVIESNASRPVPMWIDFDEKNLSAKVNKLPHRDDIDFDIEEQLIVEYYSR